MIDSQLYLKQKKCKKLEFEEDKVDNLTLANFLGPNINVFLNLWEFMHQADEICPTTMQKRYEQSKTIYFVYFHPEN